MGGALWWGGWKRSRQRLPGHDGVSPQSHVGCVPERLSLLDVIGTCWSSHVDLVSLRVFCEGEEGDFFNVKTEVKINLQHFGDDLLRILLYILAHILDPRHLAARQSLLNQVRLVGL